MLAARVCPSPWSRKCPAAVASRGYREPAIASLFVALQYIDGRIARAADAGGHEYVGTVDIPQRPQFARLAPTTRIWAITAAEHVHDVNGTGRPVCHPCPNSRRIPHRCAESFRPAGIAADPNASARVFF